METFLKNTIFQVTIKRESVVDNEKELFRRANIIIHYKLKI